jgi:hypothetical protein
MAAFPLSFEIVFGMVRSFTVPKAIAFSEAGIALVVPAQMTVI